MKKLLILLILVSCGPKFKSGDCIGFNSKDEFYPELFVDKVDIVGKRYYKFKGYKNTGLIESTDELYRKIDDKFCEGME